MSAVVFHPPAPFAIPQPTAARGTIQFVKTVSCLIDKVSIIKLRKMHNALCVIFKTKEEMNPSRDVRIIFVMVKTTSQRARMVYLFYRNAFYLNNRFKQVPVVACCHYRFTGIKIQCNYCGVARLNGGIEVYF